MALRPDDVGQSVMEYALLMAGIGIVAILFGWMVAKLILALFGNLSLSVSG